MVHRNQVLGRSHRYVFWLNPISHGGFKCYKNREHAQFQSMIISLLPRSWSQPKIINHKQHFHFKSLQIFCWDPAFQMAELATNYRCKLVHEKNPDSNMWIQYSRILYESLNIDRQLQIASIQMYVQLLWQPWSNLDLPQCPNELNVKFLIRATIF